MKNALVEAFLNTPVTFDVTARVLVQDEDVIFGIERIVEDQTYPAKFPSIRNMIVAHCEVYYSLDKAEEMADTYLTTLFLSMKDIS